MSLNSMGLGFVFTAHDLASSAFANLERNFMSLDRRVGLGAERIKTAFRELGVGLAIFTAGAAAIGGAVSLANVAGDFEQSIAAVGAVSGASAVELGNLRDAAIDAGVATQFDPSQASLGLRDLAAAGFSAQESIQLLQPVLDLAAGSLGELSPQQAAGLAAQSMKAFGLSTDEAWISVDRMLQAVNVFALNASDLPLALGTASRGSQALNQSLSETLVALGLVKNVIPSVERSSTAVAVAMERMVDPEVQQRLHGIGVEVTDANHAFRPFLDIIGEMAPELDRMNEAQRSAFLLQTFGHHALAGVNAILTQVTTGVRTNTGATVQGAEAIAYLRDQFENAGGTAAQFRDQMLSTYNGQKQLLSGSLTTLAVVAGESFAEVFKPLVSIIVDTVNAVLEVFRALPAPAKKAFSVFVVGAGAVVALVGSVIAAKAGFALLMIGLQAAGVTMGGIVATILPAIGVVAALALVVAGFVVAFENNVGGLADYFADAGYRISLAFRALVQLFEDGGFSGAVRTELDYAENQGIKSFVINLFQIAHRIGEFFSGMGDGFRTAIEGAAPLFAQFTGALQRIGEAFGMLSSDSASAGASIPSAEFASFGSALGQIAGVLVDVFVAALTLVADLVGVAFEVLANVFRVMEPVFDGARTALADLFTELGKIGAMLGIVADQGQNAGGAFEVLRFIAQVLGFVIGGVAGVVVGAVVWMVQIAAEALSSLIAAFRSVVGFLGGVVEIVMGIATGDWSRAWEGLKSVVVNTINFCAQILFGFVGVLMRVVDQIASAFGKNLGAADSIRSLRQDIERGLLGEEFTVNASAQTIPTAAAGRAVSNANASMPAMSVLPTTRASYQPSAPGPQSSGPVIVNLQVDGETLATAVHRADSDSAGRSFSSVPEI